MIDFFFRKSHFKFIMLKLPLLWKFAEYGAQ